MAETKTVTTKDVELLRDWCAKQNAPIEIQTVMSRLMLLVAGIELLKGRHKKLLKLLRQAMGILPQSERGAVIANQ